MCKNRIKGIILLYILCILSLGCERGSKGSFASGDSLSSSDPLCDPDNPEKCVLRWICKDTFYGKRCVLENPPKPTTNNWICKDKNGFSLCKSIEVNLESISDGSWECENKNEFVECKSKNKLYPSDDKGWECWYINKERICQLKIKGKWECRTDFKTSETTCVNRNIIPEDGWRCKDAEGKIICQGEGTLPEEEGWECKENEFGESVCEKVPSYPGAPDDKGWKCRIDEFGNHICKRNPSPKPPETEETNPPFGDDCICIPGAWRWCDVPSTCGWGKQDCKEDMTWGDCQEVREKPEGCTTSGYNTQCCVEAGECCQNYHGMYGPDRDASVGNCIDIVCAPPEN